MSHPPASALCVPWPDAPPLAQIIGWVASQPYPAVLSSRGSSPPLGRYSFLGANPVLRVWAHGTDVYSVFHGHEAYSRANPLGALRAMLRACRLTLPRLPVPMVGGAVGWLGYDLAPRIERLPRKAPADLGLPDMHFAVYDQMIVVDHATGQTYLGGVDLRGEGVDRVASRLDRWPDQVMSGKSPSHHGPLLAPSAGFRPNVTRRQYLQAVRRAKQYIAAGDIYQVNLSQRFETQIAADPIHLFERLQRINPAPFSAYLRVGDQAVVSSSPERFLRVRGRHVQTRPIKGTRPRGADPESDRRLREELLASEKDRAELTMIVDLERNDLGRVCSYGSVRVTDHCLLETYPTVFHLVATVEGDLHERYDLVDLLKASFPGGSITGAPKVRAMQIIDELEPTRRSVYTGAVGYIGFDGNADFNIVIRTVLVDGPRATFQVGGGIVADSEPEAEYQETLDKGKALFEALR